MPSYKDATGKWYCKFYYEIGTGEKKQKFKRGFTLKRDADEYERVFLSYRQYQPTMPLQAFIELYKQETFTQLRERTKKSKEYRYKKMGFLLDKPISDITPKDIKIWQDELINQGFKSSYINSLQKELNALFNHAIKYYKLKDNPTKITGVAKVPNEQASIMRFWTFEEYKRVIDCIDDIKAKTAVNMLYWSGMRKGELYALTWDCIDFENKNIYIAKSLQRIGGKNIITATKTYESRTIQMPNTTMDQLQEYKRHCLDISPSSLIFPWTEKFIEKGIKKGVVIANESIEEDKRQIKAIHLHGLRHSHASYLISKGTNIVLISKRLGHKDVSVTLNTYSHFYPTEEDELIKAINLDNEPLKMN